MSPTPTRPIGLDDELSLVMGHPIGTPSPGAIVPICCAEMLENVRLTTGRGMSRGYLLKCVALLWLAGVALRLTVLAVPPVIPQIHADLNLSETEVGILTGLPQVLFACAAVA